MIIKTRSNENLIIRGIGIEGLGMAAGGMLVSFIILINQLENGMLTSRFIALAVLSILFCVWYCVQSLETSFKIVLDRSNRTFSIRRTGAFDRSFKVYFFDDVVEPAFIREIIGNEQYSIEVPLAGNINFELYRFESRRLEAHERTLEEINRIIFGRHFPVMILPPANAANEFTGKQLTAVEPATEDESDELN